MCILAYFLLIKACFWTVHHCVSHIPVLYISLTIFQLFSDYLLVKKYNNWEQICLSFVILNFILIIKSQLKLFFEGKSKSEFSPCFFSGKKVSLQYGYIFEILFILNIFIQSCYYFHTEKCIMLTLHRFNSVSGHPATV